jgi:hypothetical protein
MPVQFSSFTSPVMPLHPKKTKPVTFSGSCMSRPAKVQPTFDMLPDELLIPIAKILLQQAPGDAVHDLHALSRVNKRWQGIVHSTTPAIDLDYSILKNIQALWNTERPINENCSNTIRLFQFLPRAKRLQAINTLNSAAMPNTNIGRILRYLAHLLSLAQDNTTKSMTLSILAPLPGLTHEDRQNIFNQAMQFNSDQDKARVLVELAKNSATSPQELQYILNQAMQFNRDQDKVLVLAELAKNSATSLQERQDILNQVSQFDREDNKALVLAGLAKKFRPTRER